MHIIGLEVENYKRIRVVRIAPSGNLVTITGENGQGKTSVLDAIWAALAGAMAIPERPVRRGAERARIKIDLGELVVTREILGNRSNKLTVETSKRVKMAGPQQVLDQLLGRFSFDPLEFIEMEPVAQLEALRKVAKVDIDVDAMAAATKEDYDQRSEVNRQIKRLQIELGAVTVQAGLPKERVDEAEIMERMQQADARNQDQREIQAVKLEQGRLLEKIDADVAEHTKRIADNTHMIESLEGQLRKARTRQDELLRQRHEGQQLGAQERAKWEAMPEPSYASVSELSTELQQAQVTNREIGKRERRDALEAELNTASEEARRLSRQMEERETNRAAAIAAAEMPIEGLSFDETRVLWNGVPLQQLGGAEKIRVGTAVAMALNPTLKVIRIMHGEALDTKNLALLAEIAEKNDYQIWMARVDGSGTCGIVMEDGMVRAPCPPKG